MTVTLDAPTDPPTWKVACEESTCPRRLYLIADMSGVAAARARDEFDWRVEVGWSDGLVVTTTCPVHAGDHGD